MNFSETAGWLYRGIMVFLVTAVMLKMGEMNISMTTQNTKFKEEIQQLHQKIDTLELKIDSLDNMHPWRKISKARGLSSICTDGTFLGFVLYTPVDTNIDNRLYTALESFSGPKVKVNSLRRHRNNGSAHNHGRAIDLELSPELIEFLVSEEGHRWMDEHSVVFYIEGLPGSRRVAKYLSNPDTARYVFFNPSATGDHVHLQV